MWLTWLRYHVLKWLTTHVHAIQICHMQRVAVMATKHMQIFSMLPKADGLMVLKLMCFKSASQRHCESKWPISRSEHQHFQRSHFFRASAPYPHGTSACLDKATRLWICNNLDARLRLDEEHIFSMHCCYRRSQWNLSQSSNCSDMSLVSMKCPNEVLE